MGFDGLHTRMRVVIAMADGVRRTAEIPAEMLAERRRATADVALRHGFTPERADEIADQIERALTAFADELRDAADAAQSLLRLYHTLNMEMPNAYTD